MSGLMKSLASLVKGTINAGAKVPFTKEDLKEMGVKVPKSKLHLIKQEAPKEEFKECTFKLPVRTINLLKQKAVKASKPYNVFVGELLAKAALPMPPRAARVQARK